VHTGQHYDANMSGVFFEQLGIPRPDFNLDVGSGTHAEQTAAIMTGIEPVLGHEKPDLVLVYGDVNSTVAAALVCAKLCVPVGHVEAGLRSGDRRMPEEVNRLLTDQLADLLFTPSVDGNENLAREGIPSKKIHFVGNVMIDTLVKSLPQCKKPAGLEVPARYALGTFHRPSNVDDPAELKALMDALAKIGTMIPLLFPVHPRTRERIAKLGRSTLDGVTFVEPMGYLDFLYLQQHAEVVITDSGGIQEETTFLGVPCLTLRDSTERPITATVGTNRLIGRDMTLLIQEVRRVLDGSVRKGAIPPLWDGHASERIAAIVEEWAS
jgi:UDP-N-acetylglucosamine 2-epimerase (non-hydrolysing)